MTVLIRLLRGPYAVKYFVAYSLLCFRIMHPVFPKIVMFVVRAFAHKHEPPHGKPNQQSA